MALLPAAVRSCPPFVLVSLSPVAADRRRSDPSRRPPSRCGPPLPNWNNSIERWRILIYAANPRHQFRTLRPPGGLFAGPEAAGELCRMQELTGADTVIFCPGAVQADPFVEEIDFTGRHTTSDQELLAMTQLAHSRGMRVFWKPTVNCLDGTWRARISFFDHDVPLRDQMVRLVCVLPGIPNAFCGPGPAGRRRSADPRVRDDPGGTPGDGVAAPPSGTGLCRPTPRQTDTPLPRGLRWMS